MGVSILIGPIIVPVLFWAAYHYYKDRHLPEPPAHLVLAFCLGMASYWLGIVLYQALGLIDLRFDASALANNNPLGLFAYALLAIGPIEELAKLIPFLLVVVRFREFDEPIDGIIYASFIALGFSAVENFFYLDYVGTFEALARGFAGPVVHMALASIWGYYIGIAWLNHKHRLRNGAVAMAATALLHGFYDYLVIAMPAFALPVSAGLIASVWIWRMFLLRSLELEAHASLQDQPSK